MLAHALPAFLPLLFGVALQDGDLVFQTSRSSQSAAISAVTKSPWTHMGMIVVDGGKPLVFEAVQPVKLTPYDEWAARGEDGVVAVKRLREPLTKEQIAKMRAVGKEMLGKPYDLRFAWDDRAMYCSELVYKVYERGAGIRIGTRQRAGDFPLTPAVRRRMRERGIGEDERVVSPASMFADPALRSIESLP